MNRRPSLAALLTAIAMLTTACSGAGHDQLAQTTPPTDAPFAGPAPADPPRAGLIAYAREGRIELVDPATGEVRRMTRTVRDVVAASIGRRCVEDYPSLTPDDLTWSPDGRALAVVVAHSCGHTVFAVSADGSTMRMLSDSAVEGPASRWNESSFALNWFPDGSRLTVGGPRVRERANIVVIGLDGSRPVGLGAPCDDCVPAMGRWSSVGAEWSPDGTLVAAKFERMRGEPAMVALKNITTGDWTTLWTQGEISIEISANPWLPDGSLMLETHTRFAVHPADPGQLVDLEPGLRSGLLSPDRRRKVAASREHGFVIADTASGEETPISHVGDFVRHLWSPDSSVLAAVVSDGSGQRFTLWAFDADGSTARQLASPDRDVVAWQPVWP